MTKPKALFLCQTLPFPADSGVSLRSYNILRLLARDFEVRALCFFRKASRPRPEDVATSLEGLGKMAKVEAFEIPQEHSRIRLALDHARSLLTRQSYTRYAYQSGKFSLRLRQLLSSERFDLVHMDSLDLSAYLPVLKQLPVVLTHHNVESELLRRRAGAGSSPLLRRYLMLQAELTERDERIWCPRVELNVAVSPIDSATLRRLAPDARFTVLPNGVDTEVFTPGEEPQNGIVFVGGYTWFPNRDSMEFFVDHISPYLRSAAGSPVVTWVGRAPETIQEAYRSRGVRLTGYVEDIRPYVQAAACYIVPLRIGGGTRLKILDAWAMGKAVVSTSVGCEGLDARDGENILIRDDPASFAAAVRVVLEDSDLRFRIGANARATAEQQYDWNVIGRKMSTKYLGLLTGKGRRATEREHASS